MRHFPFSFLVPAFLSIGTASSTPTSSAFFTVGDQPIGLTISLD
jgi:hypothetical protein